VKKLALLLLALPLAISTIPASAEPFGLSIGEPVSQLRVLGHNADGSYQVSVPAPDGEFDSYSVFTTGKGTICDVVAVGKNQGNRLLAAYASVKNELAREYGKPSDDLDFCKGARNGSSYCFFGSNAAPINVPLELWMNMLVLRATWSSHGLPSQLEKISLRPYASSMHDAHLVVSFKSKNEGECLRAPEEDE
jgi:hypothetical protein